MKKAIGLWQLTGFAVTAAGGVLLHFLYEWTDGAVWIAPFSAVNESTWEHMKLIFWPLFIFAVIQSFFFKWREDFWCVKLKGILMGLVLIPVLFYTYNGVIGESPDWVNITIFFISAAVAFIYEMRLFKKEAKPRSSPEAALMALCIIALLFIVFTFATPRIEIFRDPTTGAFGMQ